MFGILLNFLPASFPVALGAQRGGWGSLQPHSLLPCELLYLGFLLDVSGMSYSCYQMLYLSFKRQKYVVCDTDESVTPSENTNAFVCSEACKISILAAVFSYRRGVDAAPHQPCRVLQEAGCCVSREPWWLGQTGHQEPQVSQAAFLQQELNVLRWDRGMGFVLCCGTGLRVRAVSLGLADQSIRHKSWKKSTGSLSPGPAPASGGTA